MRQTRTRAKQRESQKGLLCLEVTTSIPSCAITCSPKSSLCSFVFGPVTRDAPRFCRQRPVPVQLLAQSEWSRNLASHTQTALRDRKCREPVRLEPDLVGVNPFPEGSCGAGDVIRILHLCTPDKHTLSACIGMPQTCHLRTASAVQELRWRVFRFVG